MSMQKAQRQMPANAGRDAVGQGEAMPDAFSDEAFCPRHATGDTGSALLQAALTTENLRRLAVGTTSGSGRASAVFEICCFRLCIIGSYRCTLN